MRLPWCSPTFAPQAVATVEITARTLVEMGEGSGLQPFAEDFQ